MGFNKDKNSPVMKAMAARASLKKDSGNEKLPDDAEDKSDIKKGKFNPKEEAAEDKKTDGKNANAAKK